MQRLEARVPPPWVAVAVMGLMWVAAAATPFWQVSFDVHLPAALSVALVGLLIGLAGSLAFARARTSADPTHPRVASRLVVTGIYRFTRNPMYLGDQLLVLAWGVYLAHPLALALTPLFALYISLFQIPPEERALAARFGAEYTAYKARVRRWL